MTSLEMVDFINVIRKEDALVAGAEFPTKGFAKLCHDSFMDKVPEVLGKAAQNFLGCYKGQNGKELPMYIFPKREACLMAMRSVSSRSPEILVE